MKSHEKDYATIIKSELILINSCFYVPGHVLLLVLSPGGNISSCLKKILRKSKIVIFSFQIGYHVCFLCKLFIFMCYAAKFRTAFLFRIFFP